MYYKKAERNRKTPKQKKGVCSNSVRSEALMWKQKLRKQEEQHDGYVRCISCGRIIPLSTAEGGHFINRKIRATELENDNINPQCHECNCMYEGNIVMYRINLVKKIGEKRVNRLELMAQASRGDFEALSSLSIPDRILVTQKRTEQFYEESIADSKQKMKELQEKICGF